MLVYVIEFNHPKASQYSLALFLRLMSWIQIFMSSTILNSNSTQPESTELKLNSTHEFELSLSWMSIFCPHCLWLVHLSATDPRAWKDLSLQIEATAQSAAADAEQPEQARCEQEHDR